MSQLISFPEALPHLAGESVHLRELTEDDIPAWFARASDVESADLAGDPVTKSMEAGAAWLQKHRDLFRKKAGLRWAIVHTGTIGSVGTVGLAMRSNNDRTADLGIVIARASWGKGIGTSAVRLVSHYAFTKLGLTEIHAEVLQRNPASIRLLEKTGFRRLRAIPPTATEPEELVLYVLSLSIASAA
jgi:[ribosomal protein S5]-alanine N-acetyltransferase